ncbi:hypothetical protein K456DRAFT_1761518 [Colletotrichum gloeosporioides 23]|nr:hypothetical protein K456DRAFT_1761518 [Colletotrichum gloeosporioides 23]
MSSRKPDYVLREVVTVWEDEGQPPSILPLQFELCVRCSPERLLLFRLAISLAGSAFDKTAETNVYLHITADFLDSLDHMLLRGKHIQLAVPKDFTIDQLCDDVARSTFENAESLAAASIFSLYLPHNILSSDSVPKYKDAIERSRSLIDALRQGYERMRDVNRLYRGAGGKVHQPHDCPHGWSPRKENYSPLAPGSSPSCGSTLPFNDISRGSPPPYNGSPAGEQSPTTRSDAAAILAADPRSNHSPPEYSDAEPQDAPRLEKLQRPLAVCSGDQLMPGYKGGLNSVDITVDNLEARCSALESQMPDVYNEVKGLIEDIGRTTKEEICTTIDDSMAKAIEETVDAQVKKVKDRIWKALQPI